MNVVWKSAEGVFHVSTPFQTERYIWRVPLAQGLGLFLSPSGRAARIKGSRLIVDSPANGDSCVIGYELEKILC